jgi:hypothetical protein
VGGAPSTTRGRCPLASTSSRRDASTSICESSGLADLWAGGVVRVDGTPGIVREGGLVWATLDP